MLDWVVNIGGIILDLAAILVGAAVICVGVAVVLDLAMWIGRR